MSKVRVLGLSIPEHFTIISMLTAQFPILLTAPVSDEINHLVIYTKNTKRPIPLLSILLLSMLLCVMVWTFVCLPAIIYTPLHIVVGVLMCI